MRRSNWRNMLRIGVTAAVVVMAITGPSPIGAEPPRDATPPDDSLDKDYADELPRIAPTSPADALQTFDVEPGFRVEQVAAEPLVVDPVAVAFDANGRLFVAEMRCYSEDREKALGRIRLLEDSDGDGRFDRATVFADKLQWPTAVICYDGGVFVGAAPNIYYFKDTSGDDCADVRRTVFTGFGLGNVQGLLNSFSWGPDNRIYGATSSSGGRITTPEHPQRSPVSLAGRDFAFDPRTLALEAVSGGGQHGLSFDRWGNRFICSNSDHIQTIMFEDRYIARNPYLRPPRPRVSIAADGRAAPVFRISPVEPWRIVRTRLRATGIVPGIVEGGGKPAGYFTGATGITIYRGDAFPEEYRHSAFVGDAGGNLVHRKVLSESGLGWIARRVDPRREFLASRDIWFRPVQFANAPDGALYVLDMCREVIEHPHSLPPVIKKHLDLTSGRDRGRIYRVVPTGFRQPPPVRLSDASVAELVAGLDHANGWRRDTVARLLYQRQDPAAVARLQELAQRGKLPEGRIAAFYALAGLAALDANVVLAGLADDHPRVRQHAVRVSEEIVDDEAVVAERLFQLTADDDVRVRYQLAFTLGEFEAPERPAALARLARQDIDNRWMRLAIASSLVRDAGTVLSRLAHDTEFLQRKAAREFLEQLAQQIARQQQPADVVRLADCLMSLPDDDTATARAIVQGLAQGSGATGEFSKKLAAATDGASTRVLRQLVTESVETAVDPTQSTTARVAATRSLTWGTLDQTKDVLAQLISPRHPQSLQQAALEALRQYDDAAVARLLLIRFAAMSPRLRNEALETLCSRPAWIETLLAAIESGDFAPAYLDTPRVEALLKHSSSPIRARAKKLFGGAARGTRADVIAEYRDALQRPGNVARGRKTFRRVCANCHRLESHGHEIGPSLAAIRNRGPEAIMTHLLDPNREVDPKYLQYAVVTTDGRTLSGMIDSETATSITLKRAGNNTDTILRIDIDELSGSGQSAMPEGLEKEFDIQGLADLLAYLLAIE